MYGPPPTSVGQPPHAAGSGDDSNQAALLFSNPHSSQLHPPPPSSSSHVSTPLQQPQQPQVPLATSIHASPLALFTPSSSVPAASHQTSTTRGHPTLPVPPPNTPATPDMAASSPLSSTGPPTSTTSLRHHSPRSHPHVRPRPLPRPPGRRGGSPVTTTPTKPPHTTTTTTQVEGGRVSPAPRSSGRYKLPPTRPTSKRHLPRPGASSSAHGAAGEPPSSPSVRLSPSLSPLPPPTTSVTQAPSVPQSTVRDADNGTGTSTTTSSSWNATVPPATLGPTSSSSPNAVQEESQKDDQGGGGEWLPTTDPSGRTYYYHSKTGETSWHAPTPEPVSTSASEPPPHIPPLEEEESTPPPTTTTTETPARTTVVDHAATPVDTVADATATVEAEEPVVELAPTDTVPDQEKDAPLPSGWVETTDDATGRFYYYHAERGETTWERPVLPPDESSMPEPTTTTTTTNVAEPEAPTTLQPTTTTETPAMTTVDHAATPVDTLADATATVEAEEPVVELTPTDTVPDQEKEAPLPSGWVEATDEATGRFYYYHAKRGETTWERPVLPPSESSMPEPTTTTNVAEPEAPTTLPKEQENTTTTTTVWNASSDPVEPSANDSAPSPQEEETPLELETTTTVSEPTTTEPVESTTSVDQELPSPWSEATDPTTGRTYYFNSVTGETSWERPAVAANSEPETIEAVAETTDLGADASSTPNLEEEKGPDKDLVSVEPDTLVAEPVESSAQDAASLTHDEAPLPPGWEQVTDPNYDRPYFYNQETGETCWDRPGVSEESQMSLAVDHQLPESGTDEPKSAQVRELEPSTGPNDNHPNEQGPPLDSMADATVSMEPLEPHAKTERQPNVMEATTEPVPSTEEQPDANHELNKDDPLPSGWVEMKDETSGRSYYYHSENGETTWERPVPYEPSPLEVDNPTPDEQPLSDHKEEDHEPNTTVQDDDVKEEALGTVDVSENKHLEKDEHVAVAEAEASTTTQEEPPTTAEEIQMGNNANSLPPMWSEAMDPTSGRTYYFNSETGETSWELPIASLESEDMIAKESADETSLEVALPAVEQSEQVDSEPVQSGPDGFIEKEDVPSFENEHVQPSSDESNIHGALPPGWQEVVDPTQDRPYFYNSDTGQTSWERPSVVPVTDDHPDDVVDHPEPQAILEDEMAEHESAREAEPFDPDPSLVTDPDKVSDLQASIPPATSSMIPTSSMDSEKEETLNHDQTEELDTALTETTPDDIPLAEKDETIKNDEGDHLPSGWVEAHDEASGKSYFYHAERGETTWERPVEESPYSRDEQAIVDDEDDHLLSTTAQDEIAEEQAPGTGDSNADVPEEQQPLVRGEEQPVAESLTEPTITDKDEYPAETSETGTESDIKKLPSAWTETTDPTSGQTYYYNSETGESSWERPAVSDDVGNGGLEVMDEMASVTKSTIDRTENGAPEYGAGESDELIKNEDDPVSGTEQDAPPMLERDGDKDPLPPCWQEVVDPNHDRPYFYNSETGETSWDRPTSSEPHISAVDVFPSSGTVVDEVAQPENSQLPQRSESSTIPFSKNQDEPSTPLDSTIDAPESMESEQPLEQHDSIEQQTKGLIETSNEHSPSVVETGPSLDYNGDDQLPSGWVEVKDEASGRSYYYHAENGETTWERPVLHETSPTDIDSSMPDEHIPNSSVQAGIIEDDTSATVEMIDDAPEKECPTKVTAEPVTSQDELHTKSEEVSTDNNAKSLPPMWSEETDPTSGRMYYFNAETGETSWEVPIVSNNMESEDMIANNVTKSADETYQAAHAGKLENNQGDYEPVSGGSKEFIENEGVPPSGTDQDQPVPKESESTISALPPGWEEVMDPDLDRPYFYNSETGETSWERPIPSQELDQQPQHLVGSRSEEPIADNIEESDVMVSSQPTETEALPAKVVHSLESKDNPQFVESDVLNEKESRDIVQNRLELVGGDPNTSDPPVNPWMEATDSTGQKYFYNRDTGETSWEMPLDDSAVGEPISSDKQDVVESVVSSESQALSHPENNQIVEMDKEDTDTRQIDISTPDADSSRNEDTGESDLPSGWEEVQPRGELDHAAVGGESRGPTEEANSAQTPGEELTNAEWVEAVDPTSQTVYYYNQITGETSWEKPSNWGSTDQIPKLDSADYSLKQVNLPSDWIQVEDDATGRQYYYNTVTGDVRWDPPSETLDTVKKEEPTVLVEKRVVGPDETPPVEADGWEVVSSVSPTYGFDSRSTQPVDSIRSKIDKTEQKTGKQGRPFCATAHLAFGGNICTLDRQGRIVIRRMHESLAGDALSMATHEKRSHGIIGPLRKAEEDHVKAYMKSHERRERSDLLWRLISIAAKSKGRLRSFNGVADPNSPETAVVRMLLEEKGFPSTSSKRNEKENSESSVTERRTDIGSIEELLVRGKREEAVDCAIREGQHGLALLVAGMCGRDTYQKAAEHFCRNALAQGSPLHTVAVMFASPSQVGTTSNSLFGKTTTDLVASWPSHLAAIINNRIPGWESAVIALGDRLRQVGLNEAAHFCFMVSGIPITSPLQRDSRWTLVGCNMTPSDVVLNTDCAIESFLRTEAYEWAKRRGNPNATIRTLQAFQAVYAMRLMEYGFDEDAYRYVTSSLESLGESSYDDLASVDTQKPLGLAVLSTEKKSLVVALNSLRDRLERFRNSGKPKLFSLTSKKEASTSRQPKGDVTVALPEQKVKGSNKGLAISKQEPPKPKSGPTKMSKPPAKARGSSAPKVEKPPVALSTRPALRSHSESAPLENRPPPSDTPPLAPGPRGQVMDPMPPTEPMTKLTTPSKAPHSSPVFPGVPATDVKKKSPALVHPATPKSTSEERGPETSAKEITKHEIPKRTGQPSALETTPARGGGGPQIPKAPSSAPANLHKMKSDGTPKSSDKKKAWFDFGIRDYFLSRLHPDASLADVGEKMEAYYDEKLKRWVFPGEDPTDIPASAGPPPTTPMAPQQEPAEPAAPKDPLSMMMAPPPARRLGGRKAHSTSATSGMSSPPSFKPGGGPPSSSDGAASSKPPATPQFAVFKPPS